MLPNLLSSQNFDKVIFIAQKTLSKLIYSNFQIGQLGLSLHGIFRTITNEMWNCRLAECGKINAF